MGGRRKGTIVRVFEDWPHRWFGNFREQGDAYALCPSVLEFVDATWDEVTRGQVISYLDGGFCLAATSPFHFPCVFEGWECLVDAGDAKGFCVLTDGVWTWDSNLSHYVRYHSVRVPEAMVRHMGERRFLAPAVIEAPDGDWDAYAQSLPHAPLLDGQGTTPHILRPRPPKPDVEALRAAAAAAFRARDFPQAVALYAQIAGDLRASERRKLEYARDRSDPFFVGHERLS